MKKILASILFVLTIFMGNSFASTPVETLIPVENIYVPNGFDSNDNVELVVEGYLPNLCHKSPSTEVKVIKDTINVTVKALQYHSSDYFCPPMIVPFIQPVSIGVLNKGLYKIIVNGKSIFEKKSNINVAENTSEAVDDFVYAKTSYVEVKAGSNKAILNGMNPSDCYVIDEIKTISNGVDTYSVLPIMKKVRDFCPLKLVEFKEEFNIPTELKRDKILLHVRSMDGKSVNTLYHTTEK
ncbi:MAG: hypothetical protein U0T83_10120 [Bacteriovoracaceae bacterium]